MKYRDKGNKHALILVHGFGKDTDWQPLVSQLKKRDEMDGWDIHSFDYVSRWLPRRVRYGFALSPDLSQVANMFSTYCQSNMGHYQMLSFIAHSMGGLVVQRALLDNRWLRERTTHVGLFATPNGGLKPRWFRSIHRQLRDMVTSSPFMKKLSCERESFAKMRSFTIRVIAGSDDKGVPISSVFSGFPESIRRTIPGDHSTMIQPKDSEAPVVGLIVNLFSSPRFFLSYVREDEDAVVEVYRALEEREFAPWIDQRKIEAGMLWEESIKDALQESNRFLVFLSSSANAELSNIGGVFRQEVETAIAIQKDRGTKSPFVIPVRLEDQDIPDILKRFQWFDLFSEGSARLADLLERSTGSGI